MEGVLQTGMIAATKQPARRRDGPRTEDAILTAAETLFARYGFDAVSTKQLAGAAGVAIGAVYHHFPSKEALYAAATKRAFARKSAPPQELMESNDPPEKVLTRLIAWFVGSIVMDKNFGLLLKRELLDPRPSTPHLIDKDLFEQPLELCKSLLRRLAPRADVDEAVASLLALLFGFTNLKGIHAILPNVRKTISTPQEVSERVTRLLLRGLQA
jgi:AcrR family transcriptional regulator